ncbi:MAG: hypothetical protein JXR96_17860 [Deltaproteobacteria bacterium]|nr:hypothetical protein [Deltaproteobacteria bacterium]
MKKHWQPIIPASLWSALFLAALVPAAAQAEDVPVVAVFLMESRGSPLTADEVVSLTDYMSTLLGERGQLHIIPRDELRKRIQAAKGKSHKECFDSSCQIELGRELAAQYSISSRIGRVGTKCLITASVWDLRRATQIKGASAVAPCDADALVASVETISSKLKRSMSGDSDQEPEGHGESEPKAPAEIGPPVQTHPLRSKHLALAKNVFGKNETIRVEYFGTTGRDDDWICVVPKDSRDDNAGDRYDYLSGKDGKYSLSGLPKGAWEARLYLDYSDKGYVVADRLAFHVGAAAPEPAPEKGLPTGGGEAVRSKHLSLPKRVYQRKETVKVQYFDTTGDDSDWICVVPKDSRDDNAGDRYDYLSGKNGSYSVSGLPKGEWEARLYLNYSDKGYVVTDRIRFTVR